MQSKKSPLANGQRSASGNLPKIPSMLQLTKTSAFELFIRLLTDNLSFHDKACSVLVIQGRLSTFPDRMVGFYLTPKNGEWLCEKTNADEDFFRAQYGLLLGSNADELGLLAPVSTDAKKIKVQSNAMQYRLLAEHFCISRGLEPEEMLPNWSSDILQDRLSITYRLIIEALDKIVLSAPQVQMLEKAALARDKELNRMQL